MLRIEREAVDAKLLFQLPLCISLKIELPFYKDDNHAKCSICPKCEAEVHGQAHVVVRGGMGPSARLKPIKGPNCVSRGRSTPSHWT